MWAKWHETQGLAQVAQEVSQAVNTQVFPSMLLHLPVSHGMFIPRLMEAFKSKLTDLCILTIGTESKVIEDDCDEEVQNSIIGNHHE